MGTKPNGETFTRTRVANHLACWAPCSAHGDLYQHANRLLHPACTISAILRYRYNNASFIQFREALLDILDCCSHTLYVFASQYQVLTSTTFRSSRFLKCSATSSSVMSGGTPFTLTVKSVAKGEQFG